MLNYPSSDPGALSPGREYPRSMYHATKASVLISNKQEEKALGPEWSRVYIHQDYPRVKYHWNGTNVTVKNAEGEAALGGGWANNPSAFDAYKGPRRARIEERNPCIWLDEWSVPGLSSEHRKKIKAQLLKAEGEFERSSDADPESAALASMRQALAGIAQVLLDAMILTEDLLRKEIPELVWDSAIAGGWWRRASETRQDIFPEQRGHYWVWLDDRNSKELFRAEARDWEARLLEAPAQEMRTATTKAAAGSERKRGFRAEVRLWMAQQKIRTLSGAARRLGISESALKSIMSARGKRRYGEETLNRILRIIGCTGT